MQIRIFRISARIRCGYYQHPNPHIFFFGSGCGSGYKNIYAEHPDPDLDFASSTGNCRTRLQHCKKKKFAKVSELLEVRLRMIFAILLQFGFFFSSFILGNLYVCYWQGTCKIVVAVLCSMYTYLIKTFKKCHHHIGFESSSNLIFSNAYKRFWHMTIT